MTNDTCDVYSRSCNIVVFQPFLAVNFQNPWLFVVSIPVISLVIVASIPVISLVIVASIPVVSLVMVASIPGY